VVKPLIVLVAAGMVVLAVRNFWRGRGAAAGNPDSGTL